MNNISVADDSAYSALPTTDELIENLSTRIGKDGRVKKPSKLSLLGSAVLLFMMISWVIILACGAIYISGSEFAGFAKDYALRLYAISVLLFFFCVLLGLFPAAFFLFRLVGTPALVYAKKFDNERNSEARLRAKLRRIPSIELEALSRRVKAESSTIKIRTSLLAVAAVAAASADKVLPSTLTFLPNWSIPQLINSFLMGSAIGVALLTSTLWKFDRLAFVLDEASKSPGQR